ncbi:MAG: hypothetical protein J5666_06625 [Bacilli bacterium]|nr:hypothetical protein [Bacilli bacterium]
MVEVVDNTSKENINSDISMNESLVESKNEKFVASTNSGETELGSVEVEVIKETIDKIPGPGKVIGYGFKSIGASVKQVFKHPLRLLPAIILVVIWLVINILQASGINNIAVKTISFLTFADAGTHGGFIGAVGGIIGKGLFAGAIVFLVSLFRNKKSGTKTFTKENLKGIFKVSRNSLWAYLTGIGLSMFFFLFISGGATRISFMGGLGVSLLAIGSCINKGFLFMLMASIFSKGKTEVSPYAIGIMQGLSIGLLLAALIGLININLILIILGSVLVVGGIIMMILQAKGVVKIGKEETK